MCIRDRSQARPDLQTRPHAPLLHRRAPAHWHGQSFFNRVMVAVQQTPDRGGGKDMPLIGQPGGNLDQGQVALLIDPSKHLGGMGLRTMAVMVTTNSVGLNAAGVLETLIPAYRRSNGDIKLGRRSTPRQATLDGHDNTKT